MWLSKMPAELAVMAIATSEYVVVLVNAGMDKTNRVLLLFYHLSRGERINKFSFCEEYQISERTFDRDVDAIRNFLSSIYTSSELLYSQETRSYYISDVQPTDAL